MSEAAKRGEVDTKNGNETIPDNIRKSLCKRYKVFTIKVGRLSRSVRGAVDGLWDKYMSEGL